MKKRRKKGEVGVEKATGRGTGTEIESKRRRRKSDKKRKKRDGIEKKDRWKNKCRK